MKKKQITGLSTLLLVLLLGLFTTCYADINRTWTENNIKNAIYNYRHSMGQSDSQIESYINTNASYITTVTNAFNSYKYVTIMYQTSGSLSNMAFQVSNVDGKWYLYNGSSHTTNYNDSKFWIFPSSGTAWQNNGWCEVFFNTNYYYTSKDIYESYQSNTVRLAANSCIPTNLITSPYEDTLPLTFIPKLTNTYADVWTYEDVPFYNASGEDLYLGQLFQPIDYQGYKTSTIFYWQYGTWNFRELTDYATYSVYVGTENGSSIYDIYLLSEYINENMLYDITFTDTTTEPLYTLAKCVFYIKNNYTTITNGILDPNATFSGDYKDKYDDDLQNQQDIENIEQAINNTINDTENVDDTINEYLSGDINSWADELGYNDFELSPLENPISTFLFGVVESVYDALTEREDLIIDLNHHGTTGWVIDTSEFVTPDSDLKRLVTFSMIFFYIYGNYKFFHYLISLLQTAKIDKAIATLGTDEFYDTDIM